VARRCYDPLAIFHAVEQRSGVAEFATIRQAVESRLYGGGDYVFDDIYTAMGAETGWPPRTLQLLKTLELAEEWENIFPIAEMVGRVAPGDLIVSDMYLPMSFLRRVVDEKCGLPERIIHLSSHGKQRGTVWPVILAASPVARHHGDNWDSDVSSARRAGIDAEHVSVARWTGSEQILRRVGLAEYAAVIREARLKTHHAHPRIRRAQLAQFEVNIPLLVVVSLILLRQVHEQDIDTVLMCSRDCNLWVKLVWWMTRRASIPVRVRYFVASRTLLLADSPEYVAYFMRARGRKTLLVDVSGTGRSPSHFIAHAGAQADTSVFLIAFNRTVANWVGALAPPRDDVRVDFVSEQDFAARFVIEAMNMSLESRPTQAVFSGTRLSFDSVPYEFGPSASLVIEAMRAASLVYLKLWRNTEPVCIPADVSAAALASAAEEFIKLGQSFWDVTGAIAQDMGQAEGEVIRMSEVARQRSCIS
jgi:hypothetical protein